MADLFLNNFMGHSPRWYKLTILGFLVINPFLLLLIGPFATGWVILLQFIFTLAMALKCYPLLPGGLIALETAFIGMVSPEVIYAETKTNFPVILLLMFMVAGIYFMKDFLAWLFTKILFSTRSKILLSVMFCFAGAFLSAWLDALTVIAVIIAVSVAFYQIYNNASYHERVPGNMDDTARESIGKEDLENYKGFLRNLLMHAAVGTALGGVSTLVGEPQNLLIGSIMGWSFQDFFLKMAHVSMPVLAAGLLTCVLVEALKISGFGYQLPERVREVIKKFADEQDAKRTSAEKLNLWLMGAGAVWLVVALGLHIAEVGLIGLSVIIFLTTMTGKSEEHQIGKAFEEALPFTALLVVFFAVVGMIHQQHLFDPISNWALSFSGEAQMDAFFIASAILSAISDNVFVATIYISEAQTAFTSGIIDRAQFDNLAIAINVGTNIPSVATPNGQAAFLFLLTSAIAGRIHLSYLEMIKLALPYTIVLSVVAYLFI
ncbi:MAG: sodium/proton antiporter NhaB [Bacteroidetes bacterium]|nr:sodium/proton antiporter NhaB [Bacteroidota bacterium]